MSAVRIDSERTCICCAVTVGYPEPDCEVHGMDACYGRYDSFWWGRIRLPHIAVPCCDMHNVHCEPPSELCCYGCTEAGHPEHPPGMSCVLDAPGGKS